ncbi:MAG: DNA-binding response regulator [Alphaproteobacteria bacterium]|nr:DNA-binding response regulator [Alphaproteobacteria bacterium]
MNILVIEDDKALSAHLTKSLEAAGHDVKTSGDGVQGLNLAKQNTFDALIVDRMIPGMEGLEVIRALRISGQTVPVIILSALGEVDDRVKGLRSGGDDYLVKPFAFDELLARLEILVRRSQQQTPIATTIMIGDMVIDILARKVSRSGKLIPLQAREFRLLEFLARNKGQMVTRAMLLEAVWDYHFDPQTNMIDVHISRLRGKIDKGFDKPLLKTVRGAGYMLDEF